VEILCSIAEIIKTPVNAVMIDAMIITDSIHLHERDETLLLSVNGRLARLW